MWDKPQLMFLVANLLYALAAILLLYAVLFLVIHLPIFPLREIKVTGDLKHVTREQVQFIVSRELRGNFFTIDLNQSRAAFEKLPWVRVVNVRRRWPEQLEVMLEEHVALARWANTALINTQGEIFNAATNSALPVFIGEAETAKEMAQRYMAFKKLLEPLKIAPAQITLSARRAWQLRLSNGLTVELGREQVEARLSKFASVYDRTISEFTKSIRYVDLRYPNGFAVRVPNFAKKNESSGGKHEKNPA